MSTNRIFDDFRARSEQTIAQLQTSLRAQLGDEIETLVGAHTCVYATGSCGRLEMGENSDLDAYVVRVDSAQPSGSSRLEAAVKQANADAQLPALDRDGDFVKTVDANDLLDLLGSPKDDSEGVLTKRMLLLLESRVLLGQSAYETLIDQVIDAYWQNELLHQQDYQPFVLVNDIIRYWRIVLLNHESKLREKQATLGEDRLLALRRYKSFKLRFPRCLTCFSALTYILALAPEDRSHVTKDHIREMVRLTPLERLRHLPRLVNHNLARVDELLQLYGEYLEQNNLGKPALVQTMLERGPEQRRMSKQGRAFTQTMFELVQELGGGRALHRHMLV